MKLSVYGTTVGYLILEVEALLIWSVYIRYFRATEVTVQDTWT